MSSTSTIGSDYTATSVINSSGNPNSHIDKNTFLKLLITQLRNQDPLNPVEDKEFIAQMAQFSSLEQLQEINKTMNTNKEILNDIKNSIEEQNERMNETLESLNNNILNSFNNLKNTMENIETIQTESIGNDIEMINQLINLNKAVQQYDSEQF